MDRQADPGPWRDPPRGSKDCPGSCNGVGNCNHDTGLCECPAGWTGPDCAKPLKRPCTNIFSHTGETAQGHIDTDGRDLNPLAEGYTESRCIGICDSDVARCFCDGKFKPVAAPPGSPPGTPPVFRGRPLGNHLCQPNDDGKGHALPWGQVPWADLYGPDGWCEAEDPKFKCPCMYDGFGGEKCDKVVEMFCPNQCSGHGECKEGFCKCHVGWYGTDCVRRKAGLEMPLSGVEAERSWLGGVVKQPPALTAAAGGQAAGGREDGAGGAAPLKRLRPFIYVYDLPPAYNARMLQYRVEKTLCAWRGFWESNNTGKHPGTYGIEAAMHEMMLQSEHRTFDPEEADFFYVPIYSSCFIFPIHCWADGPWWHAPSGPRVMHVTNMMLEARDWFRKQFPYWDRRGGRDHIWLMSHDEGACYAPSDFYNESIFLTHWGRTDLVHESNTAFTPDNYTQEYEHPLQPGGWLRLLKGHPCFTPGKDLVVPSLKMADGLGQSPLLGARPRERTILAFFRGDVGKHRLPCYSRGIRQKLHALAVEHDWRATHNIVIGGGEDVPGSYSELLSSSKFCLVLPGDGWSARAEDAVLHGCVPVVIMDNVHQLFEPQLDWASFSIRIKEADIDSLPQLLSSVPEKILEKLQAAVRTVWHRFAYTSHPLMRRNVEEIMAQHRPAVARQLLGVDGVEGVAATKQLLGVDGVDSVAAGRQLLAVDAVDGGEGCGEGGGGEAGGSGGAPHRRDSVGACAGRVGGGQRALAQDQEGAKGSRKRSVAERPAYPWRDDAFGTIMQWLYSRIEATR
ncbi:hypothetical protein FOA52_014258 [Chlamydomonas sp. UWO 241]|nr:hypothetical protein FOA52_014258 [Chlamydomonas sp. UWO 241]